MPATKSEWITSFGLRPHVEEGGYYREIYQPRAVTVPSCMATFDTILYMLTNDSPIGRFHRNSQDIVHFHHAGGSIRYVTISPVGEITESILGRHVGKGEQLQLLVPAGIWKASMLIDGDYSLIGEIVIPAFDPQGRTIATWQELTAMFPDLPEDLSVMAGAER
jgi:predicted cupin superfamily sugar epimerase